MEFSNDQTSVKKENDYERIKKLISQGKSERAVEELINILKNNDKNKEEYKELIIQFGRINSLNMEFRTGMIDIESKRREITQINFALLKIIEKVL